MVRLDQTVVTVALPTMSRDLDLSGTGQTWVVNAYVLAMASLVALGGKLGDRFGGVTTFRLDVTIFFLASMACGLAPTGQWGEPWIIAARVLQGSGAALMMPASAAIVVNSFGVAERGKAMAIYAGISQVFLAVGPLLGGVLTESVSWPAVFWLNVPLGLAALAMVRLSRPKNVVRPGATIRPSSVALLVSGIALVVLALQQAGVWGWGSPATVGTLVGGVLLTTWFVVTQLRSADPLVDVRLFARRSLVGNFTVISLMQFALLPVMVFMSIYAQDLLHFSPIVAGLAALPLILPIMVATQLGGRWYDRAGVRPPVLTGVAITTGGLAAFAASLPALSYPWQIPGMVVTGFGLGLMLSPTNTDALGRVTPRERSQTSGLVQTVRQLGGTLGLALVGTLVLDILHRPASDPVQHAANAVTAGFAVAAAAMLVALFAGSALLSRERVTDTSGASAALTLAG